MADMYEGRAVRSISDLVPWEWPRPAECYYRGCRVEWRRDQFRLRDECFHNDAEIPFVVNDENSVGHEHIWERIGEFQEWIHRCHEYEDGTLDLSHG